LLSGLLIIIFNLGLCGFLALLFSQEISQVLFGSSKYQGFVSPIYFAVIGLCFYTLVYSHLRGSLKIREANLFQLLSMGLVPIGAIAAVGNSPAQSILYTGLTWLSLAILYLAFLLRIKENFPMHLCGLLAQMKKLIFFGIPRIPGEFALFGLLSVPVISIAHITGVETAGYFALGFSFLQLICGFFDYVGVILLPLISKMNAEKRFPEIAALVKKTLGLSLLGSLILILGLFFLMENILGIFFGKDFLAAADITKWIISGAFPYLIYAILRNPLDAMVSFPHNSLNLTIALGAILGALFFVKTITGCIIAVLSGLLLLGLLTLMSWLRCINANQQQC
jgi:O-antigen/teichoic acid export membrane protein